MLFKGAICWALSCISSKIFRQKSKDRFESRNSYCDCLFTSLTGIDVLLCIWRFSKGSWQVIRKTPNTKGCLSHWSVKGNPQIWSPDRISHNLNWSTAKSSSVLHCTNEGHRTERQSCVIIRHQCCEVEGKGYKTTFSHRHQAARMSWMLDRLGKKSWIKSIDI